MCFLAFGEWKKHFTNFTFFTNFNFKFFNGPCSALAQVWKREREFYDEEEEESEAPLRFYKPCIVLQSRTLKWITGILLNCISFDVQQMALGSKQTPH